VPARPAARRLLAPLSVAVAAAVLALGLAACTPGTTAVEAARQQIGAPYRYGGASPSGFDCSGLTSYAWEQAGVTLPRTSRDQAAWADRVGRDELRPGDLVFYSSGGPRGTVSHVALYAGDGKLVHASSSKGVVEETSLARYWTTNLVGYGRVPADEVP
jgi:cell wall-associated NlpC family hydrolase